MINKKAVKLSHELVAAQNTIQHLRSLVEASKIINSTLNLEQLLGLILYIATDNTNADAGTIYLVDEAKKEIWSLVAQGDRTVEIRLPFGRGIAGHVAATGETSILVNAYADPRFDRSVDERTGYKTKTMLCTPMKDKTGRIVGVFQILNKKGGTFGREDEEFLEALSVHAAIAIENAKLYQEALEKKRLENEIALAREIQQMLLPDHYPRVKGYQFAAINKPSHLVSGDYYDFIGPDNDKIIFAIGDVSGKGVPAALLMASLRAGLHAQIESYSPINEVVAKLNHLICHCTSPTQFITFFYGELEINQGTICYSNCGHNPPLHLDCDGDNRFLEEGGIFLGMMDTITYEQGQIQLNSGDVVVLFTDGITEAINDKEDFYGDDRLLDIIQKNMHLPAQQLLEEILADVERFTADVPQSDDITMMIIKKE